MVVTSRRHISARYGAVLGALFALWVAGCASEPPAQELTLRDRSWKPFAAKLSTAPGPAGQLERRRAERGIPLRFRVGDAELENGADRVVVDRNCGEMLRIYVQELPPPAAGRIGSEEVLELDATGAVSRRWPIPPDVRVAAIEGDEILVPHSVRLPGRRTLAVFLRIRTDGSFRVTPPDRPTPAEPFACPEPLGDAASELAPQHRCWRYDTSQGPRLLAYEGACIAVRS